MRKKKLRGFKLSAYGLLGILAVAPYTIGRSVSTKGDSPDWAQNLPWKLIQSTAHQYQMDPHLIGAIIHQESRGRSCAMRYEEDYRYLKDPVRLAKEMNLDPNEEETNQKTSYGLMQIMGGLARDLGYKGDLAKLCNPRLNLRLGARQLKVLHKRFGSVELALAAYNSGTPQFTKSGKLKNERYVQSVLAFYEELRSI